MNIGEFLDSISEGFDALPPIAGALLTFGLGWASARLVKYLLPKLLILLRFDRFSEKVGITGFLKKGKVRYAPSALASTLAFWFLMVLVLSRTIARLDAGAASSLSQWVGLALPMLLASVIIVAIGVVLVVFLSNVAVTIAVNSAIKGAELIGKGIKFAGFSIVASLALEQLGIGMTIVSTIFVILFAAIALGLALAFGLGCKDMAARFAERTMRELRERERLRHGADLEG